jgi:Tfp pilus assembly major pilin PilA
MMPSNNANGATNTTTGSTSTAKMESYANATVAVAIPSLTDKYSWLMVNDRCARSLLMM